MRCLVVLATSSAAASFAVPCPTNTVPWPRGDGGTTCEPFASAKKDALKWLRKNAPPSDLRNAATLFGTPGGVDGLDAGVAAEVGAGERRLHRERVEDAELLEDDHARRALLRALHL